MNPNDTGVIAANFAAVEAGAQSIISSAQRIVSLLEEFHSDVKGFVDQHWQGDANEAFATLQAQWNTRTQELNTTLNEAGAAVVQGNSDMQHTDKMNAAMFGG